MLDMMLLTVPEDVKITNADTIEELQTEGNLIRIDLDPRQYKRYKNPKQLERKNR